MLSQLSLAILNNKKAAAQHVGQLHLYTTLKKLSLPFE